MVMLALGRVFRGVPIGGGERWRFETCSFSVSCFVTGPHFNVVVKEVDGDDCKRCGKTRRGADGDYGPKGCAEKACGDCSGENRDGDRGKNHAAISVSIMCWQFALANASAIAGATLFPQHETWTFLGKLLNVQSSPDFFHTPSIT
jgi:hypothetical protein